MNLLSLVGPRLDNIYQIRRKCYYSSGWNFFQSKQGLGESKAPRAKAESERCSLRAFAQSYAVIQRDLQWLAVPNQLISFHISRTRASVSRPAESRNSQFAVTSTKKASKPRSSSKGKKKYSCLISLFHARSSPPLNRSGSTPKGCQAAPSSRLHTHTYGWAAIDCSL